MRKLTYFVACSVDGFICREDGSLGDFDFEGPHVVDLLREYPETIPTHLREYFDVEWENKQFDTVLMGRRTYEVGLNSGYADPYSHLSQYVFSRSLTSLPNSNVTLVANDPIAQVRKLKSQDGLGIWLCGGASLASSIVPEIDEIVIKSNPFLMGRGKALFDESMPRTPLEKLEHRVYSNGFMLKKYQLIHGQG